jgi:hypothetical protein
MPVAFVKSRVVALAFLAVAVVLVALLHNAAALPLLAFAALWAFGRRMLKPVRPEYLPALCAIGALLVWNISGIAELGVWRPFAVDLAFMFGLFVWLWLRPGLGPVLLLSGYLLWSLLSHAAGLGSLAAWGDGFRTAISQVVLHAVALVAVWVAFAQQRRGGDA